MYNLIAIFIGGGIGAVLRYIASVLCTRCLSCGLPVATFSVNIIGSFIIGFAFSYFIYKNGINPALKLALTVGFCGGLTTFSTFSLEVFELLKNGNYFVAFGYMLLSFLVCVLFVYAGIKAGTLIKI